MSLWRAVSAAAARTPLAPALFAPQQSVAWSYAELAARATSFSRVLHLRLGVRKGSVVFTDLPDVAEGIVLQLALQRLGAAVATSKNVAALKDIVDAAGAPAGAVVMAGSELGKLGKVVLADRVLQATENEGGDVPEVEVDANQVLGYFDSKKPLRDDEAVMLGQRAAGYLKIDQSDRVAVAITLYHQLSHMALNAAYSQGACVVLPAVGGLEGCAAGEGIEVGLHMVESETTIDVIARERCTLLVVDTDNLNDMRPEKWVFRGQAFEGVAIHNMLAESDLSALRGGVCIASKEFSKDAIDADFNEVTEAELKGVKLSTLGQRYDVYETPDSMARA